MTNKHRDKQTITGVIEEIGISFFGDPRYGSGGGVVRVFTLEYSSNIYAVTTGWGDYSSYSNDFKFRQKRAAMAALLKPGDLVTFDVYTDDISDEFPVKVIAESLRVTKKPKPNHQDNIATSNLTQNQDDHDF